MTKPIETSRSLGLAAAAGAGEGVAHPAALTFIAWLPPVTCKFRGCDRQFIAGRFLRCDVCRAELRAEKAARR